MGNCTLVWRPNLESRLSKLQNKLRLPDADRFVPENKLRRPQTIEVRAIRVHPTKFDSHGRIISDEKETTGLHSYMSAIKNDFSEEKKSEPQLVSGPSRIYFFSR